MSNLIAAIGLHKRFGSLHAVKGIDLFVPAGQVVGFLGPNGAGKSTTMRMLTGFLAPTAGSVALAGIDIANDPLRARSTLGYLPEGAPCYPDMRVSEFLAFIAQARRMGSRSRERISAVCERVHLKHVLGQRIETLSKGFKRRVGLAQALLHDPPILILDEPTDGLDPNQKHEVRNLIRELGRDRAVVLSTHILEEVEAVCTRAIIITEGRMVFDGTPKALEAQAPASVTRNRMDHVFRSITTSDVGTGRRVTK